MRHFYWPDQTTYQRMLASAQAQGVELLQIPRFRFTAFASSASKTDVRYVVNEHMCSCPAGAVGRMCKHRALYIHHHFQRLIVKYGAPRWPDSRCSGSICAA